MHNLKVNINKFRKTPHSFSNKILRTLWNIIFLFFFRPSPRFLNFWRIFILRIFGASIGNNCKIYSSVKIWAPWNLKIANRCSIGDNVSIYNMKRIKIDSFTTISQDSVLNTGSHNVSKLELPLVTSEINIGKYVWICANSYIMKGVNIGDGSIIGVRSTVFSNIPPWKIAYGTPCKVIKNRELEY